MRAGLQARGYAGRASEISPHFLHGVDQPDPLLASQTWGRPMRGGPTRIVTPMYYPFSLV